MCVTSVSYLVLVNNSKVGPIVLSRGLRRGCPLSPYLFILCVEGLSSLIRRHLDYGNLHGVKICWGAPIISHMLFAYDSYFFFRADIEEARAMMNIFATYEATLGQSINYGKSGIFFSKNVNSLLKETISVVLGVSNPLYIGRYLGMPSLVGKKYMEGWLSFFK